MTNAHVVNGSDKVIVGLTSGNKLKAKVIGQDSFTDIAVKGEGLGQKQNWAILQRLKLAIGL